MEPSVKDKHIILGFVGFAILLISSIATLIVAEKFNQDNFVRLIVFVCSNLLGWLFYFSFQTVIFDTYEIYRIKFGKKKTPAEITEVQEEQPQDAHKLVPPASIPTGGEATPDIRPAEIAISPELHEKNRADYEDREQRENEERIAMVMEYIHFISNIPLRHFVWNISERFMYKKYYTGDNRARFISTLFPREFADTDIATIKNFKVEPLKTLIPIDEPENGRLDFHYPADYVREEYNQPFHNQ